MLSIALGKFAGVHLAVNDVVDEMAAGTVVVEDELAISYVADDVVMARHAEGLAVNWPGGVEPSNPSTQAEYPRDVWAEAVRAWNELPASEREAFKAELARDMQANAELIREYAVQAGFRESFGALDVLFLFLAIGSAYKLGSGAAANA